MLATLAAPSALWLGSRGPVARRTLSLKGAARRFAIAPAARPLTLSLRRRAGAVDKPAGGPAGRLQPPLGVAGGGRAPRVRCRVLPAETGDGRVAIWWDCDEHGHAWLHGTLADLWLEVGESDPAKRIVWELLVRHGALRAHWCAFCSIWMAHDEGSAPIRSASVGAEPVKGRRSRRSRRDAKRP